MENYVQIHRLDKQISISNWHLLPKNKLQRFKIYNQQHNYESMFYGLGLHRFAHGDNCGQARSPGAWGRHQSGRGGNDEPGTAAYRRAGAGGDVAGGGGKRRLTRVDDAGDERRLFHGGADTFQGKPRARHLLRGGRHPRRAAVPEGG